MLDVAVDQFFQAEGFGPAAIDRQHIDREAGFQRRVLVEIVDDHLRNRVAFDFDDHSRVLVRLIAHRRDVGEDLFVD